MDPQELVPLEDGIPSPRPQARRSVYLAPRSCYLVPLRLCRLLALLILLPSLFILVPLYMRYRVYSGQMYPMSMTDMRLIDSKISPTWCQRQVVTSNATFNAFVVPGPPELTPDLVPVSMTRELVLEDDMKEYWGFYLLKGSTVTVSACVSYPGASLIMIKGYKHLQECAYIGDNSSEEIDELTEAHKLGLLTDPELIEKIDELKKKKIDGKANNPDTMKRHKAGVSFHDPSHTENITSPDTVPAIDVTDHDPKELREILERLHSLRQAAKVEYSKHYQPPSHLMTLTALHRHRDANVDRDERRWLSFKDIDGNNSEQDAKDKTQQRLLNKIKPKTEAKVETTTIDSTNADFTVINRNDTENSAKNVENATKVDVTKADTEEIVIKIEDTTERTVPEPDSKEVFEDVLRRLEALGDRGKRVLVRLQEAIGGHNKGERTTANVDVKSTVTGSSEELDRLRKVLVEAIDEEKSKSERQKRRREEAERARAKRELMLGQIELKKKLNEDDEARDYAAEEGLEPDGYAEHHSQVNETTALDMSNSEFWSSFSSSEEALLECAGLILNLPLTPHSSCRSNGTEEENMAAARANALTYRVPANGYYFFVFNSENEVQRNYIRARFELQKTRYEVARTALRECTNTTHQCHLPLDIFSTQKVVLEVPLRNNDSLWNEQFVIISECEPRTSIYLACVIAVPILIMLFAFQ